MINYELDEYLIEAVYQNKLKRVKYLLKLGANPNARYEGKGNSCLAIAKKMGLGDIVEALEKRDAKEIKADECYAKKLGERIFSLGAEDKDEIVKLFLLGADLEVKNILGDTLFLDAVRNSKYTITDMLIDFGADIHVVTKAGRNALFYAVRYFQPDLFLDLMERGVDVHLVDKDGYNMLHVAIDCPVGGERLLKLIERGVNLNQREKNTGFTPLGIACLWENSYSALKLIEAGCDVNICNNRGKMPLLWVADSSIMKVEVLEAMLEHGADIDYEGYMNITALGWALKKVSPSNKNSWKKVALLIEYGAKIKDSELEVINNKSKSDGVGDLIEEAFVKRDERIKKKEEERK
ncbi:MAG: hypothetical protein IKW39_02480, partial [Alphaproteobacteria bacterium]|nr:hypothetical protein [Alphaproteobacteria bacterium]